MKRMKRLLLCAICAFVCWDTYSQTITVQDAAKDNIVYVRYLSEKETSRAIRGKGQNDETVIIKEFYTSVKDDIFRRLKHRSCVTYKYDYQQDDTPNHYTVRTKVKKTVFGFTASLMNYQWTSDKYSWICGQYMPNFGSVRFRFHDYAGGLYIGRQLCAKNRHRFSIEFNPSYRQRVNTLIIDGYKTSSAAVDPDGDNYTRIVTIDNYVEKQRQHCAAMLVGLRYDWYCFKHLSLFVSVGLDNTFMIAQKHDVTYDIKVAGLYEDEFFNVLIDQNGYYDFGSFPDKTIQQTVTDGFCYFLHGTASAGLQLFLGNTLSLEVSALYYRELYSSMANKQYSEFYNLSEPQDYIGMVAGINRMLLNRFGFNCKLKFSF